MQVVLGCTTLPNVMQVATVCTTLPNLVQVFMVCKFLTNLVQVVFLENTQKLGKTYLFIFLRINIKKRFFIFFVFESVTKNRKKKHQVNFRFVLIFGIRKER